MCTVACTHPLNNFLRMILWKVKSEVALKNTEQSETQFVEDSSLTRCQQMITQRGVGDTNCYQIPNCWFLVKRKVERSESDDRE